VGAGYDIWSQELAINERTKSSDVLAALMNPQMGPGVQKEERDSVLLSIAPPYFADHCYIVSVALCMAMRQSGAGFHLSPKSRDTEIC
jgi:hypothetical protein